MSLQVADLGMEEWDAWQIVVKELENLKIDINVQDDLNAALVEWGARLVKFRVAQNCEALLKGAEQ